MRVDVRVFGALKDAVSADSLTLDLARSATVRDVVQALRQSEGEAAWLALTADNVRIAINQTLTSPGAADLLNDGDEVAFLPPVTGG